MRLKKKIEELERDWAGVEWPQESDLLKGFSKFDEKLREVIRENVSDVRKIEFYPHERYDDGAWGQRYVLKFSDGGFEIVPGVSARIEWEEVLDPRKPLAPQFEAINARVQATRSYASQGWRIMGHAETLAATSGISYEEAWVKIRNTSTENIVRFLKENDPEFGKGAK